jgi:hypothetical protein
MKNYLLSKLLINEQRGRVLRRSGYYIEGVRDIYFMELARE